LRPIVKNKIGVISPQGFLDSGNVSAVINVDDIDFILGADLNALFISLKSVIFFNAGAIQMINDILLHNIMSKKDISCGFCDYDKKKFELLIKYLDNDPKLTLLEDRMHANLFFSSDCHDSQRALVWNDNPSQKSLILYMLLERRCASVTAKSKDEFDRAEGYEFKIEHCHLGSVSDNVKNYTRSNVVVYIFNDFLDTDRVDAFDIVSHKNYMRVGFKVFAFDCTTVAGINMHAINFLCRLAIAGAEYGATFIIAGFDENKLGEQVKKDFETAGFLFKKALDDVWTDEDILKESKSAASINKKEKKRTLSKQTIQALPVFIESAVETIEVMTGMKSQKESVKMAKLNLGSLDGEFISSSMAFYGNIEGMIALIFRKDIAVKACSILMGSAVVTDDEVLNTLGELVNILMGKSKIALAIKNTQVSMTLPRTFGSIDDISSVFGDKEGVTVEFKFGNSQFLFFLTS